MILYVKKKSNVLDILCLILRTPNVNDDNEEMFYGISTDFTRKVTGIFHNNWWKTIDNFVDTDTEYGTWYCSWYWRGGKEN